MTEELQGDFEDKVVELVESVSISNITLIQAELTRLFKQSEGDDHVRVDGEGEVEYECRQYICNESWIYLEDTDFTIV